MDSRTQQPSVPNYVNMPNHCGITRLPVKVTLDSEEQPIFSIKSRDWKVWEAQFYLFAETVAGYYIVTGDEEEPPLGGLRGWENHNPYGNVQMNISWRQRNASLCLAILESVDSDDLRFALHDQYPVTRMLQRLKELTGVEKTQGPDKEIPRQDSSKEMTSSEKKDSSTSSLSRPAPTPAHRLRAGLEMTSSEKKKSSRYDDDDDEEYT